MQWIDPSVLARIRAVGTTVIFFGPRHKNKDDSSIGLAASSNKNHQKHAPRTYNHQIKSHQSSNPKPEFLSKLPQTKRKSVLKPPSSVDANGKLQQTK